MNRAPRFHPTHLTHMSPVRTCERERERRRIIAPSPADTIAWARRRLATFEGREVLADFLHTYWSKQRPAPPEEIVLALELAKKPLGELTNEEVLIIGTHRETFDAYHTASEAL